MPDLARIIPEPLSCARPPAGRRRALLFFALTLMTTVAAGSILAGENPFASPASLLAGVPFAGSLMLILGTHEMAHFLASRRRGVAATWPLFIPAPHIIGTFGAFIRLKSPIPDRRALVEIGAAGPLAGFVAALPVCAAGLALSRVETAAPAGGDTFALGTSLVFELIGRLVLGPLPEGAHLYLHPVAFAGWIGLFVTALNLLPAGQLDGGHVLYALAHRRHRAVNRVLYAVIIPLGFLWWGWFIWGAFILFLGLAHPPVIDEARPLGARHRLLGLAAAGVLTLTFTPAPFLL